MRLTPILPLTLCLGIAAADNAPAISRLDGAWPGNVYAAIPLLAPANAPKIDGTITDAEWNNAVKFSGFIQEPGDKGLIGERSGFVWLAADSDYLYLAVKTSTPNLDPGGGMTTTVTEPDGAVYNDDSIEILINPDTNPNQTYHLIVNSKNVLFDRLVTYNPSAEDVKWNIGTLDRAGQAASGWWNFETRIPLKSIGSPQQGIRLNVARNWSGAGATAIVPTDSHINRDRMMQVVWRSGLPTLQMNGLGTPESGEWLVDLAVKNIQPGKRYTAAAQLRHQRYPVVNGKVEPQFSIQAREIKDFTSDGTLNLAAECAENDIRSLSVVLFDAESGELIFRRNFNGRKGIAAGRIPESATFEIPGYGSGICYYYPGFDKTVLNFQLRNAEAMQSIAVTAKLPDGKNITIPAELNQRKWRAVLPGGPLPGTYHYSLLIRKADGKEETFSNLLSVVKRKFEWEGNQLGTARIILPPFTPIRTSDNHATVILRDYQLNDCGLPDSAVSQNRELLAAPISYTLVTNGRTSILNGGKAVVKNSGDGYDAQITGTRKTADGISIHTDGKLEYDGFLWNNVRLSGSPNQTIEQLTLRIPFKAAEAKLFHAVADTIRSNPEGAIPAGNGIVWDGSRLSRSVVFGKELLHPQFVPYIWLGTEARGISFLADTSYGMALDRKKPAVRISRDNDVVTLEIDLINRPTPIGQGRSFAFGLQATPVKPLDPSMRRYYQDETADTLPGGMINVFSVYGPLTGVVEWFKQPYRGDYRLFDAIMRHITTGKEAVQAQQALDNWSANYDPLLAATFKSFKSPDSEPTYMDWWKRVRTNYHGVTIPKIQEPMIPMKYSDPRLITYLEETPAYFKSEWSFNPVGYTHAYRSFPVRSNLDYMIWSYYLDMKHGLQGIYLDDMFILPNDNTDTVAKRDAEGELHSQTGLLELRELVKRIAVMQHEFGFAPRQLQIHMTNALLIPCFSFATSMLGWEDKYGELEFQDRYTPDAILAASTGRQVGAESVSLDGIYRYTTPVTEWRAGKFLHLSRTHLATVLPYDVKIKRRYTDQDSGIDRQQLKQAFSILSKFGHWKSDSRFVPYFEAGAEIAGAPAQVLISSYRRPGQVLLVCGNQGEAAEFRLKLDAQKLNLPENYRLYDAETGKEVVDGAVILPRRDFKLILAGAPEVQQTALQRPGKPLPVNAFEANNWKKNDTETFQPYGAVEFNGNALTLASAGKTTAVYSQQFHPVKTGDRLLIRSEFSGEGYATFGLYCYGPNWEWRGSLPASVKSSPVSTGREQIFEIPEGTAKAVLFFAAEPESKVTIRNVKCELQEKQQ